MIGALAAVAAPLVLLIWGLALLTYAIIELIRGSR